MLVIRRWRGQLQGFSSSLYHSPSQTQAAVFAVSAEVQCLHGDGEHGGIADEPRAVWFL